MNIILLEQTDSTNAYAKENLSMLYDKTVIVAQHQTAGRGRLSRKWIDLGDGNLFLTFVLKPSDEFLPVYASLTQYLSVVLSKLLETYGVEPQIKWPNDVLINSKKISGILSEAVMRGKTFNGLVLGIGVNLNSDAEIFASIEKPATALNIEANMFIDKDEFTNKLCKMFFEDYETFLSKGFAFIREDYLKHANFLNKKLAIDICGKIIEGTAKDLTQNGELLLNCGGDEKVITIGDILWN